MYGANGGNGGHREYSGDIYTLPIEGDVGRLIWYKFKRRGIEIPFPMSDELLNDFMAVVYNQRRLPPDCRPATEMAMGFCCQKL